MKPMQRFFTARRTYRNAVRGKNGLPDGTKGSKTPLRIKDEAVLKAEAKARDLARIEPLIKVRREPKMKDEKRVQDDEDREGDIHWESHRAAMALAPTLYAEFLYHQEHTPKQTSVDGTTNSKTPKGQDEGKARVGPKLSFPQNAFRSHEVRSLPSQPSGSFIGLSEFRRLGAEEFGDTAQGPSQRQRSGSERRIKTPSQSHRTSSTQNLLGKAEPAHASDFDALQKQLSLHLGGETHESGAEAHSSGGAEMDSWLRDLVEDDMRDGQIKDDAHSGGKASEQKSDRSNPAQPS